MSSPLKIGAVSGLVAGFVLGIVSIAGHVSGLPYFPIARAAPLVNIARTEIIGSMIWGVLMGGIYSKVYRVLPGRVVWKILLFGIFGYLSAPMYWATYYVIYGMPGFAGSYVIWGLYIAIPYSIVLGVVYEFLRNRYYVPREEPKIIEYEMRSGFYPGAFAGLLGGVSTFLTFFPMIYTGFYPIYPRQLMDISFILSQLGSQIMWHMIFGAFLGLIYPKVYNLVPGKGITKGLIYSLIAAFMINEGAAILWCVGFGLYHQVLITIVVGGIYAITYGLVLGALYKK